MEIIFKKCPSADLFVYIHCRTAADQTHLEKKLYTHSEYTTMWDKLLDEWVVKEWYKYYLNERLIGRHSVITVLQFVGGRNEDLIKALSQYLEEDGYIGSGYLSIQYEPFKPESSN